VNASAKSAARHVPPVEMGRLARLCWAIEARRWALAVINIAAAGCFVIGCVGFYRPAWYVPSVTLFLIGSLLFLVSALATALIEHGPST
jgi:YrhK-like protein